MDESTVQRLDERDVHKLMRVLHHGPKPRRVYVKVCGCGRTADLRKDPHAWDGWQTLPFAKCPSCIAADLARREANS